MQIKVKDGNIYIPKEVWEKAHLTTDGQYDVEVDQHQIIIKTHVKVKARQQISSVRKLGFVGMWANRKDMDDSQEWVRKQREGWRKRINISG